MRGALIRVTASLAGAALLYTAWLAAAVPKGRFGMPVVGPVLLVAAPLLTSVGFALGLREGERLTRGRRGGFLSAWLWPLAGCSLGAFAVYPFGPMLIVFGMFTLGTAAILLREVRSR